ncbi:Reverse transcriptase-RNase H-integrase [Mycena venus]|uniref:Reverse transcriptase-RNase H-integrase n=1 Tax=Mycena venus TaxID=2733690 RepID=A0A8H6XGX8_9AGAR|nr:Reverse transcriptase-RNase H-integrase [Mycena venus]
MSRSAVQSQTINIHGGTGGNGGQGAVRGGSGGKGESPRTYFRYKGNGGSFTITNNLIGTTANQTRGDFRYVNLGDLILLGEIDKQNIVEYLPIHRRRTGAVVDHIKVQVQKAQQYRHPFSAQLFGFTCSAGLNALIYHDDIMTISQIQKMHAQSALASLYTKNQMWQQFYAAYWYWSETTRKEIDDLPGTVWIRLSTGKLCLDIGNGVEQCIDIWGRLAGSTLAELPSFKLMENELHTKLLCALKLDEFHAMVAICGKQNFSYNLPSLTETITLPSICITDDRGDFQSHQFLTIAFSNHPTPNDIYVGPWHSYPLHNEVMPTGWTRVEYLDNPEHLLWMPVQFNEVNNVIKWWVSQQNYVCKHLQCAIGAKEDYQLLHLITSIDFDCILDTRLNSFTLQGTFMTNAPQHQAYLFLFPPQVELVDGRFTIMNPDDSEKYYWSFDPTGLNRLTREAAEDIGLPTPQFSVRVIGWRGDGSTLDMIREFHAAKGFNPDSQDAAIAMGHPLVDIEDIQKWARDLTGKHSADCPDEEDDDEIYYSIGLC